jgi:SAM-dependent methyltransferase
VIPQPKHIGPIYGAVFQDVSVVEAYRHRPPYPKEVFTSLSSLAVDRPRRVLDVGCGTGQLARRLAPLVDAIDAVDASRAMIEAAKQSPGGDALNLNWFLSPVEDAALNPPYSLITAGESLHWLTWEVVFPRFVDALSSNGALAIVNRSWDRSTVIRERIYPIIGVYSTNREYQPYNLVEELERRSLFENLGETRTAAEPWTPTIDEYVELRHSQNGLSRQRMGESAAAFDREIRLAIDGLIRDGEIALQDGRLQLDVDASIVWGKPRWPYGR